MIEKINHYSFTTPASVHDEEALTALELAGRLGAKMNEVVKNQNELVMKTAEDIQKHGDYLTEEIRKLEEITVPAEVSDEFMLRLQNGTFTDIIGVYLGNLQERLNTLSRAVSNGEVSSGTDAEVIDIRTTLSGFTMTNAGETVRQLEGYIQTLFNDNMMADVTKLINWNRNKAISKTGQIVSVENGKWAVGSITLKKGDIVDYSLLGTPNTCVLASGNSSEPASGIVAGKDEGVVVHGLYKVKSNLETVYFMSDMNNIDLTAIRVGKSSISDYYWDTGYYIDYNGELVEEPAKLHGVVYIPIEIPPNSMLTADLQCSPSVQAITLCDEDGNNLPARVLGKNGNKRETYSYINALPIPVYVRLCSRVNKMWDDETIETTFFNDTNIQIKPIPKYRVPTFTIGNGHISVSTNAVKNDGVYKYSDMIMLFPNETIRFPSAGSEGAWLLSEWDGYNREFIQGLVKGDSRFRWVEYTNTEDHPVFVRTCAKVVSSGGTDNAIFESEFTNVKIYVKDVYYSDVKNHPLYEKKIALFGDSLLAGNHTGKDSTWWNLLAHKYNMTTEFYGGNGHTLSNTYLQDSGSIYGSALDNYKGGADYCVVLGGANDYRLNVPIDDFKYDVSGLLGLIQTQSPKTKIQVLTNMKRYPDTRNEAGHIEKDYVDALISVCEDLGIPVFNNYTQSGVRFNTTTHSWVDEGLVKALQYDDPSLSNANKHLSREAYEWLVPKYEHLLLGL